MTHRPESPAADAVDPPLTGDERTLLKAFQEHPDPRLLQPLLRRHVPSLLAAARRLVRDRSRVDDLVQETLVAAFRGMATFRGDCPVRVWLLRILGRLATTPRRWGGDGAERTPPLELGDIPDHLAPRPEHESLTRELRDRIDEAMERLPPRQRLALHLRAVEGMGYESIAAALDCSNGAARMAVLSARKALRERLGPFLPGVT